LRPLVSLSNLIRIKLMKLSFRFTVINGLSIALFSLLMTPSLSAAQVAAATKLNLDVVVKTKVANDEMLATFAIERDGTDLAKINEQVLAGLNAALDEVKKLPKIRGRLESVYTNANFTPQGKPNGWRVRGEISMRSKDLPALAGLTGQMAQKLQLSGIQFMLSDEARLAAEKQLLSEAARTFKTKAADATSAFGFTKHRMVELDLGNNSNMVVRPMSRTRAKLDQSMSISSAPVEGGDSEVLLSVSGTIEMQ
jgi:predicted secreted protein